MLRIIRKPQSLLVETKRELYSSVTWHVRPSLWRPPTDVYETGASVVIKVEIAGMRDEDLEVIIQGNQLLISGKRMDSSERRAYHQMEIPYGKFVVNIELPVGVNTDGASADYKDGFLTINLPKEKLDK
jgi:HSP20 family molecular chaperone IbpA